ncbi:hypothetical protein [Paraburkholderia solisilvae]|uniref:hypothetical protein n=1 Tax=Paraburkholderia solisilvae TaxID=624376 RepID=UPI0015825149|nr:hypothetical protein [Paraburkholderia solisilvae]
MSGPIRARRGAMLLPLVFFIARGGVIRFLDAVVRTVCRKNTDEYADISES